MRAPEPPSIQLSRPTLAVGDRVRIVGSNHPWRGHTGTVAVAPRPLRLFGSIPGDFLEVTLDDQAGHRAGATTAEVRKIGERR
jgi:hypothetical protein